jgi:hypothetical protein
MNHARHGGDPAANAVTFRPTRTGLRATATGPETLEAVVACWRMIAAEASIRQSRTVLLIDEMSGPPLAADEWKLLVDAMRDQGLEGVRIAHVKPFGVQDVEYCEIFAREAGFDARVFTDEATAQLWLRYGSQNGAP